MLTLEQYLADEFRYDQQEIAALDHYLDVAAATFDRTFAGKQWPYEFKTSAASFKQQGFSQGTVAMATTSAGRLLGCCSGGVNSSFKRISLQDSWNIALNALVEDLENEVREKKYSAKVRSSTFGNNNALTLSHISELMSSLPENIYSTERKRLATALEAARRKVAKALATETPKPLLAKKGARYQRNAFIPVRAMRACRDFQKDASFPKLERFFESGLHTQLSYSMIPDSRFDPSEMLFCLEGVLLCDKKAVESATLDRILDVLGEKQNTSAYWRPNKPFLASSTGEIVLPLSVEGANSLMRSVSIMDEGRTHDLFCSKSMPLLRRFWEWLLARALHFHVGGEECIGWHSEHVNEPDLVHIWDTCQVVEFMIAYRRVLAGHVAHRTLLLSNVKVRLPIPLENTIKVEKPKWDDVVADREPLMGESEEQAYLEVGKSFVLPRLESKKKYSYSMLLYGPPGTGKSTLAELMADALNWPLITITVSDFLGSGGAMVEARAKAIFQMLEAQQHAVILFDEIDAFLLDRDSKFYRDQETLFQFVTPGMLTKINDLRKAKRSIFIIATNYANRIDPAIKRVGRIDKRILLLPPNLARRRAMIEKAWGEQNQGFDKDKQKPLPSYADAMAKAFCYLGWNDISDVVKAVFDKAPDEPELMKRIKRIDRSTGPKFYGRRFPEEQPFEDEIRKEVLWLARLAEESKDRQFADDFAEATRQAIAREAVSRQEQITRAAATFVENLPHPARDATT